MRLVLPVDGQLPNWTAGSRWRAVVTTELGDVPPEQILAAARPSPLMSKAEKALIAAMADPATDKLEELVAASGDVALAAAVVLALRTVDTQPAKAEGALRMVLESDESPWTNKVLRKQLPDLHVCVVIAPGVRAIMPIDRSALALLHAEVLTACGRMLEAVGVLEAIPMSGAVGVAISAAYLTTGRSNAVVTLTEQLNNIDDFSALGFVARAVALRTMGRDQDALEALDRALSWPDRHPGVISAALEERAAMLGQAGESLAAQADLERLRTIDSSAPVSDPSAHPVTETEAEEHDPMAEARNRVRRQLRGTGVPGTFGGRHHSTYRSEVEEILRTEHLQTAEALLLGLMDAVEDEAEEFGHGIGATYYLTLVDVFDAHGQPEARAAVMERYEAALARHGSSDAPRAAPEQVVPAMAEPEPEPEPEPAPAPTPVAAVRRTPPPAEEPAADPAPPAPAAAPASAWESVPVPRPVVQRPGVGRPTGGPKPRPSAEEPADADDAEPREHTGTPNPPEIETGPSGLPTRTAKQKGQTEIGLSNSDLPTGSPARV